MSASSLQLQIEQLVLDECSGLNVDELQQAISEILQDLIAQQGLPKHLQQSSDVSHLAITLAETAPMSMQAIAKCIADKIYAEPNQDY